MLKSKFPIQFPLLIPIALFTYTLLVNLQQNIYIYIYYILQTLKKILLIHKCDAGRWNWLMGAVNEVSWLVGLA